MQKKIAVTTENAGTRLDRFLAEQLEGFSRGEVANAIKSGDVEVNGELSKASYVVKDGDAIVVGDIHNKNIAELAPNANVTLDITHENDDFLVVNKPAGLQVHPGTAGEQDTLVNGLIGYFPNIKDVGEDPLRPGVVHRLDKDTSGVMVIAKIQNTFMALKGLFANRDVQKTYAAIVHGVPKDNQFTVDAPIARAPEGTKQKIASGAFKGESREAKTDFEVVEKYNNYALLEAKPKTGRMHQIRVHLAHAGHPIVGDTKYYTKKERSLTEIADRHMLHAKELSFTLNGTDYHFEVPLPEDFQGTLQKLGES